VHPFCTLVHSLFSRQCLARHNKIEAHHCTANAESRVSAVFGNTARKRYMVGLMSGTAQSGTACPNSYKSNLLAMSERCRTNHCLQSQKYIRPESAGKDHPPSWTPLRPLNPPTTYLKCPQPSTTRDETTTIPWLLCRSAKVVMWLHACTLT